ncbi:hypothetical protein D9756_000224 [Leucocoprinus leucothites]|uniref:phosphatidate phosphatase n=1 Tax=Leucocoprinus leucothites TaxID=201217 RepID=A0A8H5GE72_9AGAR|nr:hypothetical protein D9756_000224 [Leucoagaricus leucothites]
MNYIRGAVNAISAPYQYYKELPPINPSTLTGAIDVIVIKRPGSNGATELACSPFHVRFGKWQVLRPSDKQVNVSVNGQQIPFSMKIGDAGEAFFVFETDEDVPADLITSPILHPTRPEEEAAGAQADAATGRFGAKEDQSSYDADDSDKLPELAPSETPEQEALSQSQEPEFLDLDAGNGEAREGGHKEEPLRDVNLTPKQEFHQPSFLRHSASRSTIRRRPVDEASSSQPSLPSPPISRSHTPDLDEQDKRVDEALRNLGKEAKSPDVEYHHDIALDIEGYHAHVKDASDQTVRSSDSEKVQFPSLRKPSSRLSPSKIPLQGTQSAIHSTHNSSPSDTDSETEPLEPSSLHTPHRLRATSEPPPELEDHIRPPTDAEFIYDDNNDATPSSSKKKSGDGLKSPHLASPSPGVQEYSWEWGAFPTPSPVKTTFGKGGRLDAGIPWKGKTRHFDELLQAEASNEDIVLSASGRLSAKEGDDRTFVVTIENHSLDFKLSLVSQQPSDVKGKGREDSFLLPGYDEIVVRFEEGKITFPEFMQDEHVVDDPTLVIRWTDSRYLTRHDHPTLFSALAIWRMNTLYPHSDKKSIEEDEPTNDSRHGRSKSEPPTAEQTAAAEAEHAKLESEQKPASLSWSQWWNRSRGDDTEPGRGVPAGERPVLRPASSAPLPAGAPTALTPSSRLVLDDEVLKDLTVEKVAKLESATAPALPSAPDEAPARPEAPRPISPPYPPQEAPERKPPKKFAKTLRLTSDQLKILDLKPGANTITFSISSGIIACTARIFVWEYTDLVVISDIDGTITKSDGLGHVFAMIGRDWTHVGVAKLYTDIVRNGYKIMYLTSRAIGQADATRGYLKGIKQNDYQLPEGPVIMSPDRLMASLHREVIMRKPQVFKMACLRDIQRLFGEHAKNPFYGGFGNRITDALSYRTVNVPSARIFTIDSSGEVKMELLELAGYKSSYIHMTDLVDQMFPPIHKKWTPEYTDFNYWKVPVSDHPLPALTPPSPTLSARSDTSNQSTLAKLRNFRLMGSRANSITSPPNEPIEEHPGLKTNGQVPEFNRDSDLQQMSSFERLVSGLRRSVSPSSASRYSDAVDSDSESEADDDHHVGGRDRRSRRRSMTSMPGSLDDLHFGIDDEDEEDGHWEDEEHHGDGDEYDDEDGGEGYDDDGTYDGELDEEMAIDEVLLAATEMKKIPFL